MTSTENKPGYGGAETTNMVLPKSKQTHSLKNFVRVPGHLQLKEMI